MRTALIIAGTLVIAVAAQVTVPMEPVPMTLQTLAVLAVGGVLGARNGGAAVLCYLVLGVLGLPVLAGGERAAGAAFFTSKTFGYLAMFLPAAAVASVRRERPIALLGMMVLAHALILVGGAGVLALHIGAGPAIEHGVRPFLLGALIKSTIAAAITASWRGVDRRHVS